MDMLNDDIAPITLEGYISGFTELMLDVFNWMEDIYNG
jgi:hypothetical protein